MSLHKLPNSTLRPLLLALGLAFSQTQLAHADTAPLVLTLPAQPLGQALNALARESGRPLLLDASLVQQRQAPALQGRFDLDGALQQLLQGSDLQHRLASNGAIIIERRPAPERRLISSSELPKVSATASQLGQSSSDVLLLDKEALRLSRGTGNADIFAGLPQLQLNNVRNEAGALDIGIRNMQGEGRVPVIIDGALQSTHTGRGYMGTADRTYIDSDLISSARISIGASQDAFSAGAVGGLVRIQTLEGKDILKDSQSFGLLLKGSVPNNNQTPDVPADATDQVYYIVKNRAKVEHFHNGSLTLASAFRHGKTETVLAYSKRRQGNYFAGTQGYEDYATGKKSWEQPPVKPGMEVVNTSYDSDSLLAKFSLRPDSEQQLKLTYRKHRQLAGEVLSAYWYADDNDKNFKPLPEGQQAMPQWGLGRASIQTLSGHYTLTSASNPLLNLSAGLWASDGKMQQRNGLVSAVNNPKNGDQYLHHYSNRRHGFNLLNQAEYRQLVLTTGLASQQEYMRPDSQANHRGNHAARRASRQEHSLFANLQWHSDALRLEGGLNWHQARIDDQVAQRQLKFQPKLDWQGRISGDLGHGLGWHLGASRAHRNPSLHEGSTSVEMYQYDARFPLRPERISGHEIGLGWKQQGMELAASYFDSRAKDYITQALLDADKWVLGHSNYGLFRNRGLELHAKLKQGRFFAEAQSVFYRKPEVCSQAEADKVNLEIDRHNARPWNKNRQKAHVGACNPLGFAWSLIPSRIQPQRKHVVSAGLDFPQSGVKIGSRLRYHSGKANPREWLAGTGASAIVDIPSTRLIDVFGEYRIGKDLLATLHIDNLGNRYAIDPGQLITMPLPGRTIRLGFEGKF